MIFMTFLGTKLRSSSTWKAELGSGHHEHQSLAEGDLESIAIVKIFRRVMSPVGACKVGLTSIVWDVRNTLHEVTKISSRDDVSHYDSTLDVTKYVWKLANRSWEAIAKRCE